MQFYQLEEVTKGVRGKKTIKFNINIQAFHTTTGLNKACIPQTAQVDLLSGGYACTLQLPGVNVCKIMNMKRDVSERRREREGRREKAIMLRKPPLNK